MKPPPWQNAAAVAGYVYGILAEAADDTEYEEAMRDLASVPGVPIEQALRAAERNAVAEARRGNFVPLAGLLAAEHPLNARPLDARPIRESLSADTYALISDILSGRFKKPRHRPKLTPDERRAKNPMHVAADTVPIVRRVLRDAYPEQKAKQIADRAIDVVAKHFTIKPERLRTHLARPRSRRL